MYLHEMHERVVKLMSYNAILNFIIDNRDTGKSTQFKKRALQRCIKHNTMCVWLRRHKDEIKKAKKNFLNDKFFKVLEVDYKGKFKKKDFKIKDNYAYYKKKPFVYFCAVSEAVSDKGIDAENIDTIVFDEFCVEEHRYNYYRGDEVSDFFKIFFTKKRTHADGTTSNIKIFMLGNRDSYSNPYYTFFKLPPLDIQFEGIKTYKNGSIAIMQLNTDKVRDETDYDKKLKELIKGTPLDRYLHGHVINSKSIQFVQRPKTAQIYAQFDFGYRISLACENGKIWAFKGLDTKRFVFTDKPNDKYKRNYVIKREDMKLFATLKKAYKQNKLYYDCEHTYYHTMKILEYLSIV